MNTGFPAKVFLREISSLPSSIRKLSVIYPLMFCDTEHSKSCQFADLTAKIRSQYQKCGTEGCVFIEQCQKKNQRKMNNKRIYLSGKGFSENL